MDNKTKFLITFPLILIFFALSPDSLWWTTIAVFFCIWAFLGLSFKQNLSVPLIFLLGTVALSTYFSINKIVSVPVLFNFITAGIIGALVHKKHRETLYTGFAIGVILISLLALIYGITTYIVTVPVSFWASLGARENFITPQFGHAFYAIFIIAAIPYILYKTLTQKKMWWIAALCIVMIALLLSLSRIAIIISVAEIGALLLLEKKKINSKQFAKPMLYCLVIAIIVVIFAHNSLSILLNKTNTVTVRLEYLTQVLRILKNSTPQRVLGGYGLDSFFELSRQFQSQPGLWSRSAHNFLAQFLIENGIIGLLALLVYIWAAIKNRRGRHAWQTVTLLALFFYSLVSTTSLFIFPIILFIITVIETPQRAQKLLHNSIFLKTLVVLLVLFWIRYGVAYVYFFASQKPNPSYIKIFPYDSAFWSIIAYRNQTEKNTLAKIKILNTHYAKRNIEQEKLFIEYDIQNNRPCRALSQSLKALTLSPFDTTIQQQLISEERHCNRKPQLTDYFTTHQQLYGQFSQHIIRFEQLIAMRQFLNWVALNGILPTTSPHPSSSIISSLETQQVKRKAKYWLNRAWDIQIKNPYNHWWYALIADKKAPIPFTNILTIRLSIQSSGSFSGITLYNKLNNDNCLWCRGNQSVTIGLRRNSQQLTIYTTDENTTKKILLKKIITNKNATIIKAVFDKQHKNFTVEAQGEKYKVPLYKSNVSHSFWDTEALFAGYSIAPFSSLVVSNIALQ